MKPARFEYVRPQTLDEALSALASHADAKPLAGGQSLVPLLNLRMTRPAMLVDLNRIRELTGIRREGDHLVIGAMTRHRDLERSSLAVEACPLLAETARHIGHVAIRNRGTVGGSVAHADPAAEWPVALLALGAELVVAGPGRRRTVAARDFFVSYFTTVLAPDELLVEIRVPCHGRQGAGWAFAEVARRSGDFALVCCAATLQLDRDGRCAAASLALGGVGATPVLARSTASLLGRRLSGSEIAAVARAVAGEMEPETDLHASAAHRRGLAEHLAAETLSAALRRAGGED